MKLKKIKLCNFRNFKDLEISFDKSYIYIIGKNGVGKTNIVEAITILSLFSSFRTNNFKLLKKKGTNHFSITGEFIDENNSLKTIQLKYINNKKEVLYQNKKIKKLSEIWGKLPLIYLVPGELEITNKSPGLRRKFFDELISVISLDYLENLKSFYKLLKQKNVLLKNHYNNKEFNILYDIYNRQLASRILFIVKKRENFINSFRNIFQQNLKNISNEKNIGNIEYKTIFKNIETEEDVYKFLNRVKDLEITKRMTLIGPQKDDFYFSLNNLSLKDYGSQGQCKIFLISLKLAQLFLLYQQKKEYPIFILDDLFNELDEEKCRKIGKVCVENQIQTFVTSCDVKKKNLFKDDDLDIMNIENLSE